MSKIKVLHFKRKMIPAIQLLNESGNILFSNDYVDNNKPTGFIIIPNLAPTGELRIANQGGKGLITTFMGERFTVVNELHTNAEAAPLIANPKVFFPQRGLQIKNPSGELVFELDSDSLYVKGQAMSNPSISPYPSQQPYDKAKAIMLVKFSQIAYQNENKVLDWLKNNYPGWDNDKDGFHFIRGGLGTQLFVASHSTKKEIVVSFRGSDDIFDFLQGLKGMETGEMIASEWSGRLVQKTYYEAYTQGLEPLRSAQKQLVSSITNMTENGDFQDIYVTGHSMGGSLAIFCALDMAVRFPNLSVKMYSFGAPPVIEWGNLNLFYNDKVPNSYRFVNTLDPIPRDVFKNLLHVPYLISITGVNREAHIDTGHSLADSILEVIGKITGLKKAADATKTAWNAHMVEEYVDRVNAL